MRDGIEHRARGRARRHPGRDVLSRLAGIAHRSSASRRSGHSRLTGFPRHADALTRGRSVRFNSAAASRLGRQLFASLFPPLQPVSRDSVGKLGNWRLRPAGQSEKSFAGEAVKGPRAQFRRCRQPAARWVCLLRHESRRRCHHQFAREGTRPASDSSKFAQPRHDRNGRISFRRHRRIGLSENRGSADAAGPHWSARRHRPGRSFPGFGRFPLGHRPGASRLWRPKVNVQVDPVIAPIPSIRVSGYKRERGRLPKHAQRIANIQEQVFHDWQALFRVAPLPEFVMSGECAPDVRG